MGALLMAGLASFGASIAIGLLGSSTPPPSSVPQGQRTPRSLAIVMIAFCAGNAILGIVVGLLAVNLGAVAYPANGLLAAGPAIIGAGIGLVLLASRRRTSARDVSLIAALFIIGLASLGVVVALLAYVIVEQGTTALPDWPFLILGTASAASALAIGATGARALRSMSGADEPASQAIAAAQISRCAVFQGVAIAASVVAIALIVLG